MILTYGNSDNIIWYFLAALEEDYHRFPQTVCSCINPTDVRNHHVPEVFGNNYFCDAAPNRAQNSIFYSDDPLWDEAGCEGSNTCCTHNNPPWFFRELPEMTDEDIKMKINLNEKHTNEDIGIEKIDIYIQ